MDVVAALRGRVADILTVFAARGLLRRVPDFARLSVEPCRDPARGDVSVNAALVYASLWQDAGARSGQARERLSEALACELAASDDVAGVTAATGGYVNVLLHPRRLAGAVSAILSGHPVPLLGRSAPPVRIVVATPRPDRGDATDLTHLRAAVVADALGRILAGSGHAVAVRSPGAAAMGERGLELRGTWTTTGRLPGGTGAPATRIAVGLGAARPQVPGAARRRILLPVAACRLVPEARISAGVGTADEGDAWRLGMLCRGRTSPLAFDPAVAADHSHAGALFDIGYAHARAVRSLRVAIAGGVDRDPFRGMPEAALVALASTPDRDLLREIALFPHAVERSIATHEPHRLAAYLRDLAAAVHRQWRRSKDQPQLRFFNEEQRDLTKARLALTVASTVVLKSGLGLFGIAAPDEMQ